MKKWKLHQRVEEIEGQLAASDAALANVSGELLSARCDLDFVDCVAGVINGNTLVLSVKRVSHEPAVLRDEVSPP